MVLGDGFPLGEAGIYHKLVVSGPAYGKGGSGDSQRFAGNIGQVGFR